MNRFITLLAILFVVPVSSRDLHVYNNLLTSTLYYKIGAKPSNGNSYPKLYSLGPAGHFVSLGPLSITVYTNSVGFPFYSPTSSPVITTWQRQLTATSTPVNTASSLAQTLFGATHRYSEFKFYVEDSNANIIGSGNIDPPFDIELAETYLTEDILTTYIALDGNVFILFDEI